MLLLVPKLNEKTINNQLLKFFAKLQLDEQVFIEKQPLNTRNSRVFSVEVFLRSLLLIIFSSFLTVMFLIELYDLHFTFYPSLLPSLISYSVYLTSSIIFSYSYTNYNENLI